MSHSVSRHLRLAIDRYDAAIRQFIPGYDPMLDAAVDAVLAAWRGAGEPRRVVDLGSGTGALAERLLERTERCVVELWDVDPEMLGQARQRLDRFGDRAVPRERSFSDPLEGADAAMASLALHHVREPAAKHELYAGLAGGLGPGGVLVNADATISTDEATARQEYRSWVEHMVDRGIGEARAWQHLDEWAEEDRYFSVEQEIAALEAAGLEVSCEWRSPPMSVLVGRRRG